MPVNLINTEFTRAAFWQGLIMPQEMYYQGPLTGKVQHYKTVSNGEAGALWVAHVICREDEDHWEAARDMVDRAVKDSAAVVRGAYSFELLAFEPENELKTFNMGELSQVITNTARKLKIGEVALVRYSSVYGLLQKRLDESWGKMTLKTSVAVLDSQPKTPVALLTAALKAADSLPCPGMFLFNDLSFLPLLDPLASEEQQAFLDALAVKRKKIALPFSRWVYVRDRQSLRQIM